jgi:hypothetical protein
LGQPEGPGGLDIRTEAEVIRWPKRYMDERGEVMWRNGERLLAFSMNPVRSLHDENMLSHEREGTVASMRRCCRANTTPYPLIKSLIYMSYITGIPKLETVKEIEVETSLFLRSKTRRSDRFLKSPIPPKEIATAAQLPEKHWPYCWRSIIELILLGIPR